MRQFKIVVSYQVSAEDKSTALELFTNAKQAHRENDYFESQYIKEVEPTGWKAGFAKQISGK